MHSYALRINCNHLKPVIVSEYLRAKDVLCRGAIFAIANVHYLEKSLGFNLCWEEEKYNEMHRRALRCGGLRAACDALSLMPDEMAIAMDIGSYVRDFIMDSYRQDCMCYLSMRVDTACYVVLEMVRLRVRAPSHYQVGVAALPLAASREG